MGGHKGRARGVHLTRELRPVKHIYSTSLCKVKRRSTVVTKSVPKRKEEMGKHSVQPVLH